MRLDLSLLDAPSGGCRAADAFGLQLPEQGSIDMECSQFPLPAVQDVSACLHLMPLRTCPAGRGL